MKRSHKSSVSATVAAAPAPANTVIRFVRGDQVEAAEALISVVSRKGPVAYAESSFWAYESQYGIWARLERADLREGITRFAGARIAGKKTPLLVSRGFTEGAVDIMSDKLRDPTFFDAATPGIAFANGFVTVSGSGISLVPHSPDHRARWAYPFRYRKATCPRFHRLLRDVFAVGGDAKAKMALIQEYGGMCIIGRAASFQIALIFVGEGSNGKTTLIEIIALVMPDGSVVAVSPHDMGDEYRRAMLAGVRFNGVSELPEADILDAESVKSIISGDRTTARSPYQAPFTFAPIAGHIFGANRLPAVNDPTNGFWRRFRVVEFARQFAEHEQVKDLAKEIATAEAPGIVAWFLQGAVRALKQGKYTLPESHESAIANWRKSADQIAQFIDERTYEVSSKDKWTSADAAYDRYKRWATKNGHRPLAANKFGERMRLLGRGSVHTEKGNVYPCGVRA